jgi:RNA polymerase sigma-54 factor
MSNSFSQSLDLRQSQQLIMTPQLRQAIEMLQLNNTELSELVDKELAQNPLLEKAEPEGESGGSDDAPGDAPAKETDSMQDTFDSSWDGDSSPGGSGDFDAGVSQMGSGGLSSFEDSEYSFENRLSDEKSLRDHLIEQLHISCDDERDRMIGAMLIDRLDESGYLRDDPETLIETLGCSEERLHNLLGTLKGFDPTGVFAADLKECMALQLDEQGKLDEPMKIFIENLELIGSYELKKLQELCGVNETYLHDMLAEIKTLNPKPAAQFDHFVSQTLIPDVLMKRIPKHLGGGWRVELNNETLPRVLVNQEYYTTVLSRANTPQDKTYLNNQLTAANWLVRALDQRAQTILKTASKIIEEQDAFFLYGVEFLKPMTLKDIAEKIEMHESTVSRVTTNKYIGTPRGLFELKYFFTTGLAGSDGLIHSAESIKAKIKAFIDAESPKKILSDDKLVDLLKEEGMDVARRTVAKYREALNIPSSVQRRRMKNQGG